MLDKLQDTIVLALLKSFESALKTSGFGGWRQILDAAARDAEDDVSVTMLNEFERLMQKGILVWPILCLASEI